MTHRFYGTYQGITDTFNAIMVINDTELRVEEIPSEPGYHWIVDGERRIGRYKDKRKAEDEVRRLGQIGSYAKGYCFEKRTGRWLTQPYYGRYDTEEEAAQAAADKINYANANRKMERRGKTYPVRVKGVSYGVYGTQGEAILIRDVIYRRVGISAVTVRDYEMPLGLATHWTMRKLLANETIEPVTVDQQQEYARRVEELNSTRGDAPRVTIDWSRPADETRAMIEESERKYRDG